MDRAKLKTVVRRRTSIGLDRSSTIMAASPKPLVYCESGKEEGHIVCISTHPSQDLLAAGDIVGKISL